VTAVRILVIEDDPDIWRLLEVLLRRAGFEPLWASDGLQGLRRFGADSPDLVLLDVGLPELDGWEVLERIRDVGRVPVLLLTARGLETDKVRGLLGGADDYLTKPFDNDELVARIGVLLRRPLKVTADVGIYDDGLLEVDFSSRTAKVRGSKVQLTPTEFRLLAALVRHAGHVLSLERLLEMAWGDPGGSGTGKVRFAVMSLRRKLGWGDDANCPLESVRGFGYRYRSPD